MKLHRDETGRVCSLCLTYKLWSQFNKGNVQGHKPQCRECQRLQEKGYYRDPAKNLAAVNRYNAKKKLKGANHVETIHEDTD